jgi:DNA-binding MarR family transcriptional regulator
LASSLLKLDLMRTFDWFDEQLRARLAQRGWDGITRSQSLVLANVANGVTRPSRIAEHLGVTRQAMSQLLSEMAARGLVDLVPDPDDRRAQRVVSSASGEAIREAARGTLRELEQELEGKVGTKAMQALRAALKEVPQDG